MAAWTFRKKKQQQSRVFFGLIFLCLYQRVQQRKNQSELLKTNEFRRKKNMEIQSSGKKMRNASGQQGENERQRKIKAKMNTGNKILCKHIRQFLLIFT